MILFISATKPVIKALVKYDLDGSCDDVMSVKSGVVKVQGVLAKKINEYFSGNAYEINTVREVNRILN